MNKHDCLQNVWYDGTNKGQLKRSSRLWWRPVAVVQKQMRRMLLLPGWSCAVWASASSPPIGECRWALQTPCVGPPPFDAPGEGEDGGTGDTPPHTPLSSTWLGGGGGAGGRGVWGIKRERKPEERKIQRKRKRPSPAELTGSPLIGKHSKETLKESGQGLTCASKHV